MRSNEFKPNWTRAMNRLSTLMSVLGGDRGSRNAGLRKWGFLSTSPIGMKAISKTTGPPSIKTRQLSNAKASPVTRGWGYTSKGPGINTASYTYTKVPSGGTSSFASRSGPASTVKPDYSKDIAKFSKSGYHIYKKGSRAATDWRAKKAAAKGKNFMFNKVLYKS